jgi:hypothetical protein
VSPSKEGYVGDTFTLKVTNGGGTNKVNWDLDGDGLYEVTDGGFTQHATFDRPGTYVVADDVHSVVTTYHVYESSTIVVRARPTGSGNQAPTASFTTDASPGYTERPVAFDATSSSDSDGQVVSYEWDFESDGTWDATGVRVTHAYNFAGTYQATLRVTDNAGATATTVRSVPVVDGVPPGGALTGAATAARAGTPFHATVAGVPLGQGSGFLSHGALLQVGTSARGTLKLSGLPSPLQRKRSARWAAAFTYKQRGNNAAAQVSADGYMLLAFGARDRLCLRGRVGGPLTGSITGKLTVAGGSAGLTRLRGGGTLAVAANGKAVDGRLALAHSRKTRGLPKACRSLVRKLR